MKTFSFERIIARAKNHIFCDMSGINISKKEGDAYDFAQIREHAYCDNVKRIDWKKSSKTSQLQQRVFFEEKEIIAHIICLMSGSMHFGINRMKQEVLAEIVALLGFSAYQNSDLFSISLLGKKLIYETPISKKESLVREGTKKTLETPTIGVKINWNSVEKHILYQLKKSSLVFLIGDYFDIPKLDLINKKHTIIVIIIRDYFEERPSKIGSLLVRDPITLKEEKVVLDEIFVKQYIKKQKRHDIKLENYLKKNHIRFVKVYTNEDPFSKLSSIFRAY